MGAKIQTLLALQETEYQLADIRRQINRKQRAIAAQEAKQRIAQREIDAEAAEVQRMQMRFDELDVELKGRNAEIDKHRQALNSVRTNKEYAAILSVLNNEKADLTRVEAQAMEMMQAVEERKEGLAKLEADREKIDAKIAELSGQLGDVRTDVGERLNGLEAQKREIAATLSAEELNLFDRLSERYDGEALAAVQTVNPRGDEFMCNGCNMTVTADYASRLRFADEIITCKSCGRILFVE